jgi:dihydroorotate dehydrogenase (NAD+) catalytic subunit
MGGVQYWQDAAEFILAGASAVAIGTSLFVDPATPNKVCTGLDEWLKKQGVDRLTDLVGALELPGDQPKTTPYP